MSVWDLVSLVASSLPPIEKCILLPLYLELFASSFRQSDSPTYPAELYKYPDCSPHNIAFCEQMQDALSRYCNISHTTFHINIASTGQT